jgi:predicted Zn-dependent protease with MMP-like domain
LAQEKIEQEIDTVWDSLDAGDISSAFEKAVLLAERYPDDAQVQLTLSAAAFHADDPEGCRKAAKLALGLSRHEKKRKGRQTALSARLYLARVDFRMWRFRSAERHLRRILDTEEEPEAWDLLACILEQTGRREEASEADRRAAGLDPEAFPAPVRLSDRELEEAVGQALQELPERFQEMVDEIPIVIEDFPKKEMATSGETEGLSLPPDTLGLFVGTSLPDRSFFHLMETPGTIFLFKGNLEREAPDRETLIREIAITLWHELAHYLGFEETEMPRLGLE